MEATEAVQGCRRSPERCISPPRRGEGRACIYLLDAGGERGTGKRLACKWDFWEVESWLAFSLELSWFPIGNIPW